MTSTFFMLSTIKKWPVPKWKTSEGQRVYKSFEFSSVLLTNQDRIKLLKLLPPDRKIKDVQTCKYVNFINFIIKTIYSQPPSLYVSPSVFSVCFR